MVSVAVEVDRRRNVVGVRALLHGIVLQPAVRISVHDPHSTQLSPSKPSTASPKMKIEPWNLVLLALALPALRFSVPFSSPPSRFSVPPLAVIDP